MDLDELYERVNEELDLEKKSRVIIIYGSRTRDDYSNSSDLDILVIPNDVFNSPSRIRRKIDGVTVDIMTYSLKTLERTIKDGYWDDSNHYESVFTTGIVKYDPELLVPYYKNMIVSLNDNQKEDITEFSDYWKETIYYEMEMYKKYTGNKKKLHYYNLIETFREIYHLKHHYSSINVYKVYDLYTNEIKSSNYKLNLPPKEFRDALVEAMSAKDMDKSINRLLELIGYTYEPLNRLVDEEHLVNLPYSGRMKDILIEIGDAVYRVEDMILHNSPAKDFAYYELLALFYMDYKKLNVGATERFYELYNQALDILDSEGRIRILEELYCLYLMDNRYIEKGEFDIDDFEKMR